MAKHEQDRIVREGLELMEGGKAAGVQDGSMFRSGVPMDEEARGQIRDVPPPKYTP